MFWCGDQDIIVAVADGSRNWLLFGERSELKNRGTGVTPPEKFLLPRPSDWLRMLQVIKVLGMANKIRHRPNKVTNINTETKAKTGEQDFHELYPYR